MVDQKMKKSLKKYFSKPIVRSQSWFFWPLRAVTGAARKKIPRDGAAWGKNQEPEPLKN